LTDGVDGHPLQRGKRSLTPVDELRATNGALFQQDRTIFLDVLQRAREASATPGRSGKKCRRTGRTATACARQSPSQDGT